MGSERVTSTPATRKEFVRMLVLSAIAAALGIALALIIDWFPIQASREAEMVDTVWDVLLIVAVPIFVLVMAVVLYCVTRFRMRPGEEELDGAPIHGNTRLEVIWTAIPAILMFALSAYSYVVLTDMEEAAAEGEELNVRVVGEQFTWTFYYPPEISGTDKEIASNQLYLPVDKRVKFLLQSKDVIHDFWVPAFRMKLDAVPGITTDYRTTPTREGRYPVVCAELCGLGHAAMRQTAIVVPAAEFDTWIKEKATGAGDTAGESSGPGGAGQTAGDPKAIFADNGCGSCHALADAGTAGQTGPNLDESLDGKDADYIRAGIVEPDRDIAKGFGPGIMPPNYGETLSPEEVDSLTEYLAEVTK